MPKTGCPYGVRTAQDERSSLTPTAYWDCQSVPDTRGKPELVNYEKVDQSYLLTADQIANLQADLLIAGYMPDSDDKAAVIRAAKDKLARHELAALHLARTSMLIAKRRDCLKRISKLLGESVAEVAEVCNQEMIAADERAIASGSLPGDYEFVMQPLGLAI